jgi:hypothetical protein
MHGWTCIRVQRLHQVNLDTIGPLPKERDVFVDVFFLAAVVAVELQSERIDPKRSQAGRSLSSPPTAIC